MYMYMCIYIYKSTTPLRDLRGILFLLMLLRRSSTGVDDRGSSVLGHFFLQKVHEELQKLQRPWSYEVRAGKGLGFQV